MKRINVLALSYLFPNKAQPAYGIFVLNRLKAVQSYCNVKVIAPVPWYPFMRFISGVIWKGDIPRQEEMMGLDVRHPRFAIIPRYLKSIDSISYFFSARRLIDRMSKQDGFEYDLVDAHWTYPDIVAAFFLARSKGKKFIVTVRGHEALYLEENTLRKRLLAFFLKKADAVVTLSEELRGKAVELGVSADRVRVILNGVDLSHFHLLDRHECRRQLGLPLQKKILVSVGRLTEAKGHQDLIRMLPDLQTTDDVELYIVGGINPEDDFHHVLLALVGELKLKNVHFINNVDHKSLQLWYAAADLFCLATKREGCPNVVLEALACGTPAVVNDVGAVSELVVSGENGFLVNPQDAASWASVVRRALSHSWDREKIADRMKQWGWEHCGEQVYELYRSLLK